MGIASMVIGIVALMIGFIPFCGTWAIIPACAGIGLGIADVIVRSKRGQSKGMAIAGLILNPLAVTIILLWWATAFTAAKEAADGLDPDDVSQQLIKAMQDVQKIQPMPGTATPGQGGAQSPPLPGTGPTQMEPMQPVPADPPQGAPKDTTPAEQPPAQP